MVINKESHSGIQYKGIIWFNSYDNPDKWLKSIYEHKDSNNKKSIIKPIITKLVINGESVINDE